MANTNIVPQGLFGPGILWLTRTDTAANVTTPTNVGFVNEFSYDFAFDTKQLYGQNQFPLLAARGTAKCTGKIKAGAVSGQALNTLLIGGSWTTATQYDATTVTVAAAASVTPTVPSTGTWDADLGVTYQSTGEPLFRVASAPAVGSYSVAAGVYTFNAGEVGSLNISFAYHFTSGATGQNQIIANNPIGTTPTFQLDYKTTLYGATYYLRLYNAIGSKWAQNHKITDFAMPEYDFEFFSNASQQVGLLSLATQA